MGKFIYDGIVKVDVDDRVLAHLQAVIGNKLKRGEPFFFTWNEDQSAGFGRTSVWVSPRSSLVYKYAGSRRPALNLDWIEELTTRANSLRGLQIVPEPAAAPGAGGVAHGVAEVPPPAAAGSPGSPARS